MERPRCLILVGLPGAGKTTFRKANATPEMIVVSSDDYLEAKAIELGKDYAGIFKDYINIAGAHCDKIFSEAVAARKSIIIDRTNSTIKSRAKYLSRLPKEYIKEAIVMAPHEDTLVHRLKTRTDKFISFKVVADILERLQLPSFDEGFNRIITYQDSDISADDVLKAKIAELIDNVLDSQH